MLNSAVQAVLNATDTWFIGRLSPAATSAMGAVYWPVLVFILLFGGVGLSVQTLVAQAYGSERGAQASQATWTALWACLFTVPAFTALALSGSWIFSPFGIAPGTLRLALDYWFPRMPDRAVRHRIVVAAGLFQRHRPAGDHAARDALRSGGQCGVQPTIHIQFRPWGRRIGLGDGRRAIRRRGPGAGLVPERGESRPLPLAPHRPLAASAAAGGSSIWAFRWGCCTPPIFSASPCSS